VSYNASVVKIYNATSSLVRFQNKNIFYSLKNALVYFNAGAVNSQVRGIENYIKPFLTNEKASFVRFMTSYVHTYFRLRRKCYFLQQTFARHSCNIKKCSGVPICWRGTDVMISNTFSPKDLAKNWRV
jgi:hypothetical protein